MSDYYHNNESARVDAEKDRIAREICAEVGAPWPPVGPPGATVPEPEDGETEESFLARTAPQPGCYRVVPPKMTLQEALIKQQANLKKAKQSDVAASSSSSSSSTSQSSASSSSSSIDPIWRAQILQALHYQGYEPAPADYPDSAAYHTVPDIGVALVVSQNNQA